MRTLTVTCAVDIEKTVESFHAHAIPQGIAIRPGDIVLVHGAPLDVAFGEHVVCERSATVTRAGFFTRAATRAASIFALTELYEVGFEPKEVT